MTSHRENLDKLSALNTPLCPRAVWRVVTLTVVTLGLYYFVWLGLTWSEMKRELRDETMYPVWHALTQFVPVYGWFRLYEHFQTINVMLYRAETPPAVNPGNVVRAAVIATVVGFFANLLIFDGLGELLYTAVVVWFVARGQAGLNAYWKARAASHTVSL